MCSFVLLSLIISDNSGVKRTSVPMSAYYTGYARSVHRSYRKYRRTSAQEVTDNICVVEREQGFV